VRDARFDVFAGCVVRYQAVAGTNPSHSDRFVGELDLEVSVRLAVVTASTDSCSPDAIARVVRNFS
jgi:hypothetical protein